MPWMQQPIAGELADRIESNHQRRNARSARFFEENAAGIRTHQAEICEAETYQDAVLELIDGAIARGAATADALEVGPGSGTLLAELDQRYGQATGLDNSRSMLAAAATTLADRPGIRLEYRDFMKLTDRRACDLVVAAMVIHHQASPAAFFRQAADVLRGAGCLVVAELCRHDQEWAQSACNDQWLGFEPDELCRWAEQAGFETDESQYLAQKNGFRLQVHRFVRAPQAANANSN